VGKVGFGGDETYCNSQDIPDLFNMDDNFLFIFVVD